MSYLIQYLPRACAPVVPRVSRRPGTRVDERSLLNRPGYHGGAYVRVLVEDTSTRRIRRRRLPTPRLKLEIADCTNQIRLEFSVSTAGDRENSLFKIATLLGALERFQGGLTDEAELYAERERARSASRRSM
jgi:hypothetical protein